MRTTPIWYYDTTSPCKFCPKNMNCPHVENWGTFCDRFMDAAAEAYNFTKESVRAGLFDGLESDSERVNVFLTFIPQGGKVCGVLDGELDVYDFALEALVDMAETPFNKGLFQGIQAAFTAMTLTEEISWFNIWTTLSRMSDHLEAGRA